MGNPFIPLPRIENALIIGDRAAEKHLECAACLLNKPA